MTDYWVSSERHYCKYCNAWMQGDKSSIRHHEQGRKHRELLEATLKHNRRAKSDAMHAERDVQKQLREIEKAAQAKFAKDMAAAAAPAPPPSTRDGGDQGGAAAVSAPLPPPPPPRRQRDGGRGGGRRERPTQPQAEVEEEPLLEDEGNGIYAVRDVVYLEGKRYEEQLLEGTACQIWVEELEDWFNALIERVDMHVIPNTDVVARRFSITYMPTEATEPVTEHQLTSERLRIKAPDDMTLEAVERMMLKIERGEAATIEEAYVPTDRNTGMGEWSTVAVQEVDESEEAIARREAEELAEGQRLDAEEKQREVLEDPSVQGDHALGAFNPWGGTYKGIELESDSVHARQAREEEIQIQPKGDVGFKKRKIAGSVASNGAKNKKKQRRLRTADDE